MQTGRDADGLTEEGSKIMAGVDDVHGGTREDVGGTDEDGVANLLAELLGVINGGQLPPLWLINAEGIQHAGELVAVLSRVDHLWGGPKDLDALVMEAQGNVVGGLSSHGHNHSA
jgi:hypothetical protein